MLVTNDTGEEETQSLSEETTKASLFHHLNSDPGRATVDNLISEITKLQYLRQIGLPDELFQQVSPKVLHIYKTRAATEPPRDLRWHPEPIRSNNEVHRPVILALELLKKYADSKQRYYSPEEEVPIEGVLKSGWREILLEKDPDGNERINRINYEISVLQALRERLRCKEIWVVGANRYRNPDEDLPADFEQQRETYYQALKQPLSVEELIAPLKQAMMAALTTLNDGLPKNPSVKILTKNNGWIRLSPLDKQPEPVNILRLKTELIRRWPMTSLLDILKEADLRIGFTECFKTVASREALDYETIQKRLLLCLYGLGTNTGLKRVSDGTPGINFYDLRYIKRRFMNKEQLRNAIAKVVNAIFQVRLPEIWGEGTTTCASDSKKFGAWDQNLMTEWHIRVRREVALLSVSAIPLIAMIAMKPVIPLTVPYQDMRLRQRNGMKLLEQRSRSRKTNAEHRKRDSVPTSTKCGSELGLSGMVIKRKSLLNVVRHDKPKVLIGLNQKVHSQVQELRIFLSRTPRLSAKKGDLTHSGNKVKHGKPVQSPVVGKPTVREAFGCAGKGGWKKPRLLCNGADRD